MAGIPVRIGKGGKGGKGLELRLDSTYHTTTTKLLPVLSLSNERGDRTECHGPFKICLFVLTTWTLLGYYGLLLTTSWCYCHGNDVTNPRYGLRFWTLSRGGALWVA